MISQATVDVSDAWDLSWKYVPTDCENTYGEPGVPPGALIVRKIREFAVIAVVATVTAVTPFTATVPM